MIFIFNLDPVFISRKFFIRNYICFQPFNFSIFECPSQLQLWLNDSYFCLSLQRSPTVTELDSIPSLLEPEPLWDGVYLIVWGLLLIEPLHWFLQANPKHYWRAYLIYRKFFDEGLLLLSCFRHKSCLSQYSNSRHRTYRRRLRPLFSKSKYLTIWLFAQLPLRWEECPVIRLRNLPPEFLSKLQHYRQLAWCQNWEC